MPSTFPPREILGQPGSLVISTGFRSAQLIFSIIVLGTSAHALKSRTRAGPIIGIVSSILSVIYIIFSVTSYQYFTSFTVIMCDSSLAGLWISAVSLLAGELGVLGSTGQAALAFSVLSMASFWMTYLLHLIFAFSVLYKVNGAYTATRTLSFGGIFLVNEEVKANGSADPEVGNNPFADGHAAPHSDNTSSAPTF